MIRWKSKLAQSATNAAITIILIAVLIVFYILFMSPEDRAALLGDDPAGGGGSGGGTSTVKSVLLSKTPGRLYPLGENAVEHTMPSFMVFTVTNAGELKRTSSLYVKNSAFGDTSEEMIFFFDSRTMSNVKLSFNVKEHSGRLIIKLNEYKLFEGEITQSSPVPFDLPQEYLKEKNGLVFEASDAGAAFWRVNSYTLENVLISAKITDYSGAFSEQHFSIGASEYEKIESAVFEFLPDCPPKEEGMVQILINNRPIYTSYPDCGIKTSIEVSKEFLKPGDNVLVATTSTGSFLLDLPKITTSLQGVEQPVFYLNIPANLYEAMYYGQRGLMLSLRFTESTTVKRGTLEINGFKSYFETQDIFYQTSIDPEFVTIGPNSIKITPQANPLDVVELRVDVI
ncbi:MAG TPA: hypothetical protein VJ461_04245 [Candidatus Nanoarchaeia archaeon]|nr:hypothetical protein [Candidatus Nanoarchaeia archaeon]